MFHDVAPMLTAALAATVIKTVTNLPPDWMEGFQVWLVFFLCFACSGFGVWISIRLLGSAIRSAGKSWMMSFAITVVMLSLSYGAKYSHDDARKAFNVMDFLTFSAQGFLWPSTWPSLAKSLGVTVVEGPKSS